MEQNDQDQNVEKVYCPKQYEIFGHFIRNIETVQQCQVFEHYNDTH